MTKEEARLKLNKVQSTLNRIAELKEDIKELEALINKKDDWTPAPEDIWRNKRVFSYEDFIRWGNVPYERVIMQLAKERIEEENK